MADGPLRGVRIVDLTHVWAGPLATRVLADLGAEVVKVEAPDSRGPRVFPAAPPGGWIGGEPGDEPWNRNALFAKLARNKRSVALDLKQAAGRTTFLQLVAVADVVIENFSARAMPSLGLGFDALRAANPEIIYVSMPGHGMSGPYRDRVAFGPTIEAMSGFTSVTGYDADQLRNSGMALMDPVGGINATAAVTLALRSRNRQRDENGAAAPMLIEFSLHEGGVTLCGPWLIDRQLGNATPVWGNRHPQMAPHGVYRCAGADAWVALACRDQTDWRALCSVVAGLDAGLDLGGRRAVEDAIDTIIGRWCSERDAATAASELQHARIPAGPLNTTADMVADAQVRARGFFVPLDGGTPMPGNPIHMDGISSDDWQPCPRLGADNAAVLRDWLGHNPEQIGELERDGVLADRPPA